MNHRGHHLSEQSALKYVASAGGSAELVYGMTPKAVLGSNPCYVYEVHELQCALARAGLKVPDVEPYLSRWQKRRHHMR